MDYSRDDFFPSDPSPRILAVHSDTEVLRQLREEIGNRWGLKVDTSTTSEYGFELALGRRHALFFLELEHPQMRGELLYHFLSVAYVKCHTLAPTAPGVAFLSKESRPTYSLEGDVRVKAVLPTPLNTERVLKLVQEVAPARDRLFGEL